MVVVQATVVEDEAFGLRRELEGDVELVSGCERGEGSVCALRETSGAQLTKFVEERIVRTIPANL